MTLPLLLDPFGFIGFSSDPDRTIFAMGMHKVNHGKVATGVDNEGTLSQSDSYTPQYPLTALDVTPYRVITESQGRGGNNEATEPAENRF